MDMALDNNQELLQDVQALYRKGLFKQALQLGEEHWGAWRDWTEMERKLMALRMLSQLGLRRSAKALTYQTKRLYPTAPEVDYYFSGCLLDRHGPFKALNHVQNSNVVAETPSQIADRLSFKAALFGYYRDWETAQGLISKAKETDPESLWVHVESARLLSQQDLYDQAYAEVEPLFSEDYLPAIMLRSRLLRIQDGIDQAIEVLLPYLQKMESFGLTMNLCSLYKEKKEFDQAFKCLEIAKDLIPGNKNLLSEEYSIAQFESLYQQDKPDEALSALESVRSPFYRQVRKNLETKGSTKQALLEVPFVRQHHMTCVPATLTALFQYWGHAANHLEISEEICYDGTTYLAERDWVASKNWPLKEFELTKEVAVALLDRGIPFTLSTMDPGSAHLQAVIGYDLSRGLFLVRDPYYPAVQEMLIEQLGEYYQSSGPRCMAFVPPEKADLFNDIQFPSDACFDYYFSLQKNLQDHNRDQAVSELEEMRKTYSEHRLCLWAERSLARYDGDKKKELELVEALLNKFPEDLNLQNDKSYLFGELGQYQQQIDYLRSLVEAIASPHPIIVQSLVDCIRRDKRQSEEVYKWMKYLLRLQPTNASVLWSYAGELWGQGKFEEAFQLYRLCSCVEDKNEGYVESYFRAARFLKRTRDALNTLEKRVQEFGDKSPYPFISLYYAYETLNQDQQAVKVLEQAVSKHENDSELLRLLTNAYVNNARTDQAEQLLAKSEDNMHRVDWLSAKASIAIRNNQWQSQLECYEQILKIQPLNFSIIQAYARLLAKHKDENAALDFVKETLAKSPENYSLQHLYVDWLGNESIADQEKAIRSIIKKHPHDEESLLRLARVLVENHRVDEALELTEQALQIAPRSIDVNELLGYIHQQKGNLDKAKDCFRKTILIAVDTHDVFDRLLRCCKTIDEKKVELEFIYEQLMKQTSFGNGILEYKDSAQGIIGDDELERFLKLAVDERPDLWQSWSALASFYLSTNRIEQAIATISRGIELFPFIPRLLKDRSFIYFSDNQFPQAENDLKAALELNPQWLEAVKLLADCLEAQQKNEEMLRLLQTALIHSPTDSSLYGYIADIFISWKDYDKAAENLTKAIELEPAYQWAWETLEKVASQLKKHDLPLKLARRLVAVTPGNAYLLKVQSDYEETDDGKLNCLNKALELRPKNIAINTAYCRFLFDRNLLTELHKFIHHEKWLGKVPNELRGFEAWSEAQYHRFDKAESIMLEIVKDDPTYYNGWRLLSRWSQTTGNHEQARRYIDECIKLFPHNADTLTLAAETYTEAMKAKVDIDYKEIAAMLEKAVECDPRNQYRSLTWLDHLLDCADTEGFERALDVLIWDKNNFYYKARVLQYYLLTKDNDNAIDLFKTMMLTCDEQSEWLFDAPYAWMIKEKFSNSVKEILQLAIKQKNINPLIARPWVQFCFDHEKKKKKLIEYMDELETNSPLWMEATEVVFQSRNNSPAVTHFIKHYSKSLKSNGRLWSLVAYHYAVSEKWNKVIDWCKDSWKRKENNAFAVYFYNLGLRFNNNWKLANEVNEFTLTLPEDEYYDRVYLWREMDNVIFHGELINQDVLSRIRYDELAPLEQYAYYLLGAIDQVQQRPFLEAYEDLQGTLKQASKVGQTVLSDKPGQWLKRSTRRYIGSKIEGGFWLRVLFRIKLFNLM